MNILRHCNVIKTTKISNNSKNSTSTPKVKSNECTASMECDKSPSKDSNNSKKSSSTTNSKSNKCTASLECDKSSTKVSNNSKISSCNPKLKPDGTSYIYIDNVFELSFSCAV